MELSKKKLDKYIHIGQKGQHICFYFAYVFPFFASFCMFKKYYWMEYLTVEDSIDLGNKKEA